jgi:hypothetical protein
MTVIPDFLIALFILISIIGALFCGTWLVINMNHVGRGYNPTREAKFICAFLTLLAIIASWIKLWGG